MQGKVRETAHRVDYYHWLGQMRGLEQNRNRQDGKRERKERKRARSHGMGARYVSITVTVRFLSEQYCNHELMRTSERATVSCPYTCPQCVAAVCNLIRLTRLYIYKTKHRVDDCSGFFFFFFLRRLTPQCDELCILLLLFASIELNVQQKGGNVMLMPLTYCVRRAVSIDFQVDGLLA